MLLWILILPPTPSRHGLRRPLRGAGLHGSEQGVCPRQWGHVSWPPPVWRDTRPACCFHLTVTSLRPNVFSKHSPTGHLLYVANCSFIPCSHLPVVNGDMITLSTVPPSFEPGPAPLHPHQAPHCDPDLASVHPPAVLHACVTHVVASSFDTVLRKGHHKYFFNFPFSLTQDLVENCPAVSILTGSSQWLHDRTSGTSPASWVTLDWGAFFGCLVFYPLNQRGHKRLCAFLLMWWRVIPMGQT